MPDTVIILVLEEKYKQKKDPDSFLNQGHAIKDGGLLLSRIALQYHRRKRA